MMKTPLPFALVVMVLVMAWMDLSVMAAARYRQRRNMPSHKYYSDRSGYPYHYGRSDMFADDAGKKFNEINVNNNSKDLWRPDGKCGPRFQLPTGGHSQCNPKGETPCCNPSIGMCGKTPGHCACAGCIDYRSKKNNINAPARGLVPPPGVSTDQVSILTPNLVNEIKVSGEKKKKENSITPGSVPDILEQLIKEATAAHDAQALLKVKISDMYNKLIDIFTKIRTTYLGIIEEL